MSVEICFPVNYCLFLDWIRVTIPSDEKTKKPQKTPQYSRIKIWDLYIKYLTARTVLNCNTALDIAYPYNKVLPM